MTPDELLEAQRRLLDAVQSGDREQLLDEYERQGLDREGMRRSLEAFDRVRELEESVQPLLREMLARLNKEEA